MEDTRCYFTIFTYIYYGYLWFIKKNRHDFPTFLQSVHPISHRFLSKPQEPPAAPPPQPAAKSKAAAVAAKSAACGARPKASAGGEWPGGGDGDGSGYGIMVFNGIYNYGLWYL